MFDSILGPLLEKEPTRAVLRAGGLGYEVRIPLSTYERLPRVGQEATLLLHAHVREDEWRLFGFATPGERDVFRALLRVSGIGPVLALSLLSGLKPEELRSAVAHGDVRVLTRVKGVGRKTAERIVVELRDVIGEAPTGAGAPAAASGPREDAIQALLALGIDAQDAARRVDRVLAGAEESPDVSVLVRAALRGAATSS